jgi:hypothetical protein
MEQEEKLKVIVALMLNGLRKLWWDSGANWPCLLWLAPGISFYQCFSRSYACTRFFDCSLVQRESTYVPNLLISISIIRASNGERRIQRLQRIRESWARVGEC